MGEVETIKMEYKVKQGPVGKGRLVKQLSQHQAFQAGFWFEILFFFTHPVDTGSFKIIDVFKFGLRASKIQQIKF